MSGSVIEVADAISSRTTFLVTSHARPDGDAIGSSMALALALEQLGKRVRVLLHDPVPVPYRSFPSIDRIEVTSTASGAADAVIFLECSDPSRPEIAGLDRYVMLNVDHHLGNAMYGAVNWYEESRAACGELVADLIDRLNVEWTPAIASHLYLALATDTGGFRYGPITAHTFDICRRISAVGVETAALSREIFESYSIGRVKLTGMMLNRMELVHANQLAILQLDDQILADSGATLDDTEGLVNLPLGAREVKAVALFKKQADGVYRVSLRSKGHVDVRAVAALWNGGGHLNAAGCTATGSFAELREAFVAALSRSLKPGVPADHGNPVS